MDRTKGVAKVDGHGNVLLVGVQVSTDAMYGDFSTATRAYGDLKGLQAFCNVSLLNNDRAFSNQADKAICSTDGTDATLRLLQDGELAVSDKIIEIGRQRS